MRAADRGDHAVGHRPGRHPQLRVHAGDHHVELAEQVVALVERAVVEDVDFDSGQDAKRGQLGVEPADEFELCPQALSRQAARHGQPRRVIGQRDPFVPETAGRLGHLLRRAAAVRPVGVRVAITAQRRAQARPPARRRLSEQPGQVGRLLAVSSLRDGLGGNRAYPGQRR